MQPSQLIDRRKDYDFLRAIMVNLPAVAFVIDPDGTILFAEGKSIAQIGLKSTDVVGTNVSTYFSMYPGFEEGVRRALEGETLTSISTAPSQHIFEVTYSPMRDDRGLISGITGVAQDVTERIEQEQALRNSEEKFRSITSATADAIVMMDQSGLISMWNDAAQAIFGYTEREAIGQNFYQLITPAGYGDRGKRESIVSLGDMPLTGKTLELIATRMSGEEFPVELSLSAFSLNGQWHAVGTARDITKRKQAEELLRESERLLRQSQYVAQMGHYVLDATSGVWTSSEALDELFGIGPAFPKNVNGWVQLVHPEEREEMLTYIREYVLQNQNPFDKEYRIIRADDGVVRWVHGLGNLDIQDGKAIRMFGTIQDVTVRRRAEEARRESEEKFRRIFDEAPWGMTMASKDYRFIRANAAFCKMLGYSAYELSLLTFRDITHADHLSEDSIFFKQVLSGELPRYNTEKRYIRKDKTTIWGALTLSAIRSNDGQFLYLLSMIEDITERKRAQEERERLQRQLQQSQKIEAIGLMAGGIAHDFNNILTGILGFTELARLETPAGSSTYENLTEVLTAGHRARDLVRQILFFSRKTKMEKSLVSLVTIVKEALKLIRSVIPSHITIRQNYTASVEHSLLADPTQLHQIVMNLCLNAADAMPDGGVLEISVDEIEAEVKSEPEPTQSISGRNFKLTVRDSGIGMPPEVQERIFEPYYTTKQIGKGTGMGMAVVHGVVQDLGGNIAVTSEWGKGTTVTVCLPIVETTPCVQVVSEPVITTGNESILFVDDEAMITSLEQLQLGKWGYRVTATVSSATALNIFRSNPKGYDLVITDLAMPGITGVKLAEAIHEISPETPIILCTGFEEGISRENAHLIGIQAILSKPITSADFSRTIRRILDNASTLAQAKL